MTSPNQSDNLIFIDPTVEDYQKLVEGALPDAEVIVLNSTRDGVEQIGEVLAKRRGIRSLHIVSHGAPGQVQLGSTRLSSDTLDKYASQLQQWSASLTADADILFYGCDIATPPRSSFIQRLSELTGADVAASTDKTGSAAVGGDWELEAKTGKIEAEIAFQPEVTAAYNHLLALNFTSATNFVVGSNPNSVAVGNFNADAISDLAVANYGSNNVSILLGNGAGGFGAATNFAVGSYPRSVAVGDFNADAISDLAVANYSSNDVSILLGNGTGGFGAASNFAVGSSPESVAVGNFNADAISDLAVANVGSNNVSILLGNGAGGFGTATNFAVGTNPRSVAVGNFNADAIPDLAVANASSANVSILLGNGTGGFGAATNFAAGSSPSFITVGNFNADAIPDLAVANYLYNNVSILLGNGTGGFGTASNFAVGSVPSSVAVGDFNADAISDLAVANNYSNNVSILLGNGTGGFGAATNFGVGTYPLSVAVGNFNADSMPDLAVANEVSNDVSILLNNTTAPVGNADTAAISVGTPNIKIDVLGNDTDVNGDYLKVQGIVSAPTNGTAAIDDWIYAGGGFTAVNGTPRNYIARLNSDGSLDTSFNPGSGMNNAVLALALQSDGKPIVGGFFTTANGTPRNYIARLNGDGSLDTSFDPGSGMNNAVLPLALQSNGKLVVGGAFTAVNGTPRNYIARLNGDGSLDTSFDPGSGMNFGVRDIALQPDGKPVVGGAFTAVNGTTRNRIARLNADGSLDASFNPGTGMDDYIEALALQSDGKPFVGGNFTTVNGTSRNRIARLNSDGSLDTSFNPGSGMDSTVFALTLQPDGKPLVGGSFTTVNGTSRNRIARLNSDGSLDTSFNPGLGMDDAVNAIALQLDGKPIVGGVFTAVNGTSRNYIARLNSDGSLDTSFNPGTGMDATVAALAIDPGRSITYTPNPGFNGIDTFQYTLSDGTDTSTATVTVVVNDSPVLDTSGNPFLTNILANDTNNPGTLIAELLATGASGNPIADANAGAQRGIAIIGVDSSSGTWQYTTDGGTWNPISAPSINSALLLADNPATRIRFLPNPGYAGIIPSAITFHAWDGIGSPNGSTADVATDIATNSASSPFSSTFETASLTVIPTISVTDVTVLEGNSGTTNAIFTVSLSAPFTSSPVTVDYSTADNTATANSDYTAASGTLTFNPGEITKTLTIPIIGEEVKEADELFFLNLSNPVNATILDSQALGTITDDDTNGITVSPISGNTSESGATATFTVVLTSQPTDTVTIAVSSDNLAEGTVSPASVTFTPADWNIPQTVTVTGADDAVADGNIPYNILLAGARSNDANYNNVDAADVAVINTDNDSPAVLISQTGGSTDVTEGGAASSYTVLLATQPTGNVIISITPDAQADVGAGAGIPINLIFTPTNWNVAQTVSVTATDDALAEGNHTSTIAHAVAAGSAAEYLPVPIGNVTVNITDNDSPGVSITQSGGSTDVTEGGNSDSYAVVLTTQPTSNVTIAVTPDAQTDLGAGASIPINLTFTPANWNVAQTVSVAATDDMLAEGNHTSTITHAVAAGSAAEYLPVAINSVTANITDNDSPGVSISQSGSSTDVTEGGNTDTYTVVLTTAPSANVIVTVTPDAQTDLGAGAGIAINLTFTAANWNAPQTVSVAAVDDVLAEGNHISTIAHAVAAGSAAEYLPVAINSVTANLTDNDSSGVSISQTGGSTEVAEGGDSDTYTVVLTAAPTSPVTVNFTTDGQLEAIAPITFTSANWNVAQTVTVKAIDDNLIEGNHSSTIRHLVESADANFDAIAVSDVVTSIADNDAAGISISQTGGSTEVAEGGNTDTYTLVLTAAPTADVTVNFTTDGQVQPIAPITFTPANWNVAQTVTVKAVNDAFAEGSHASTIQHVVESADANYNNLQVNPVTATIADDDTAGISIALINTNIAEGGAGGSYSVVLTAAPTAPVAVNFTADGQLQPIAPISFDASNWNIPQTVTVEAADDALAEGNHTSTIAATVESADFDYNNYALNPISVNIADNDSPGVAIVPTAATATEGGAAGSYTVALTTAPTAPVVINFSTDGQLNAIPAIQFDSTNWNVPQTVQVIAADDNLAEGIHSSTITHTAASADVNYNAIGISDVTASIVDNDAPGVSINPGFASIAEGGEAGNYTVVLTTQPKAPVEVDFTTDEQLQAISSISFDATNWNIPQTVTVEAANDPFSEGEHFGSISHRAISADIDYNDIGIPSVTASIADNDPAGIPLTLPVGSIELIEGFGEDIYKLALQNQPTAAVTIKITTDGQTTTDVENLIFTPDNWNLPQTVKIRAVDDEVRQGTHLSTISFSATSESREYNNLAISNLIAIISDNDDLGMAKTLETSANYAAGDSDDRIFGSLQGDNLHGRNGDDLIEGGEGDDIIYGGDGSDGINGNNGSDQIYGGTGSDYLNGNAGSDVIYGGAGNDRIRGGAGNDLITGDDGNDYLFGDLGADWLAGGRGKDAIAIGAGTGGMSVETADILVDFTLGEDVIDLIGSLTLPQLKIFQGTGANANDTIIQLVETGEYLAVLQGVSSISLTPASFV